MVDATPPDLGKIEVKFFHDEAEYFHDIVVQWRDFVDLESGVVGYEIGVGSVAGSQDVSEFQTVVGINVIYDGSKSMHDGKYYYFQVKVRLL